MKIKYIISKYSITGLREKEGKRNEDSYFVVQKKISANDMAVFAGVADGMGGLENGKEASRFVAERLEEWFNESWDFLKTANKQTFADRLLDEIRDIHYELRNKIENEWDCMQAGSTLALLYVRGKSYIIVNVGDSRIYLNQGEEIRQITHDQTFAQHQIDIGELKEDEIDPTDRRVHTLLQALGASLEISPDFYFGKAADFYTFFICSDGMINRVDENEVKDNLRNSMAKSEKEKIANIMKLAMTRGENDNMTGIIIKKCSPDDIETTEEISEPQRINIPSESDAPTGKI